MNYGYNYKRKMVLEYASKHDTFTKKEIVALVGQTYYCNGHKHIGEMLSRMVKSNHLVRVRKGLFAKGTGKKQNPFPVPKNQNSLF